ncbi:putative glycosyltransferase [Platanthera zijinensis]|uniref:Glycosyltransferase n=1 Tax=Platanthera zijinensis TaxID=2320716 RepID=A0AAP0B8K0_9ASPA
MATLLRLAAAYLIAAGRRIRRDGVISGWRRKIVVIAFLTAAMTSLLARSLPMFRSSASARPSSTVATANSAIDGSLPKFSPSRDSSLLPYSSNSSAEASVLPSTVLLTANFDGAERKINDLRADFLHLSTFEAPKVGVKSSVSGWRNSSSTGSRMDFEEVTSDNQMGEVNISTRSEIQFDVVKSSDDGRQVPTYINYKSHVGSLPPDEALIYARKEIKNSLLIFADPDLYAPLFLNVSVFKRSYELMEKILKVYIYRDGQRPIFHTPELKGIYASEGWFMKLIEQNRHFIVKDPGQAHLFYLPYSARRMELALYVPDSHDMKPLSRFLRDYVNQISSKYPFWNRTRGSDHFLVACHDWGPYTTNMHAELRKNTIKALCNADTSEGIFQSGRDVSLPETTIRTPRRPLRQVGGRPISQRSILAFFAGNMHGRVRPILLEHWGNNKDEEMRIYGPLPSRISKKMSYVEHMKSSKFCICPMGFEVNSPRIVEAIYYECVPVIIADNFVLPLEDVLDWSAFSVVVAEKDIPKLKDILLGIPLGQYVKMQECVKRVQRHFLWHARPVKYDLFHMILHSIWSSLLNHI